MILRNLNQKRILFSEDGIERWQAAMVARAILRRIECQGQITVNHFDVTVINQIHEVLHTGRQFNSPFRALACGQSELTINVNELGF